MVILSPAMEAREGSKEVSQLFKMGCDFDGFFTKENVAALTEAAGVEEGVRAFDN
jgi:heterodisulfide reductase subunit A-like polyferredoxin